MSAAAACGGSGSEDFTRDDLVATLQIPPPLPEESSWSRNGGLQQRSLEELQRVIDSDPERKGDLEALANAGYQYSLDQAWVASGRSAKGEVTVFRDSAAAEEGFAAIQHLTPGWFFPSPVDDLGDEAVSSSAEPGAVYMWRRGNAVLEAWMFLDTGSAFDYDGAARAYADQLDERATSPVAAIPTLELSYQALAPRRTQPRPPITDRVPVAWLGRWSLPVAARPLLPAGVGAAF